MAPIKFDKDIRDELEKRVIQPSGAAWDKLEERLETNDKAKSNKTFWRLGIAASVVGVLLVTTQFFKSTQDDVIEPQVVDTKKVIKAIEDTSVSVEPNSESQEKPQEVVSIKKETIELSRTKSVTIDEAPKITPDVVVENDIEKELKLITVPTKVIQKALTFEEQKIKEVVAQVQELKKQKNDVTDAEIEALLQQAQQEIALKKLYSEKTLIVDASVLLEEVEADLDKSFRTKVLEALKASYGTVKTAIANRNK